MCLAVFTIKKVCCCCIILYCCIFQFFFLYSKNNFFFINKIFQYIKKIEETKNETIDAMKLFSIFSLPHVQFDYTNDDPQQLLLQQQQQSSSISPITPTTIPPFFDNSTNTTTTGPTNTIITPTTISPTSENTNTISPTTTTKYHVIQPFLIWLASLAETVDTDHLPNSEWTFLRHQLNHALDDILHFGMSAVRNCHLVRTQNLALNCLQRWVRYGVPFSTILRDGSILDLGFKCLVHASLFEESAALLSEILSQRPKQEYNDRMRACAVKLVHLLPFYEQSLKSM